MEHRRYGQPPRQYLSAAPVYAATVTNSDGCMVEAPSVLLTEPSPLHTFPTTYSATCPQSVDGKVLLSVSRGVGPYSFQWSNGATGQSLVNVAPGSYSATIADANGCSVQAQAVVEAGEVPGVSVSTVAASCQEASNGRYQPVAPWRYASL
ncbi:MAG: SprB repeat-containing protein [Lewinellaceae bacterium]|nr:SprB repeat-containing protein [Lewinellaceae bacterium]